MLIDEHNTEQWLFPADDPLVTDGRAHLLACDLPHARHAITRGIEIGLWFFDKGPPWFLGTGPALTQELCRRITARWPILVCNDPYDGLSPEEQLTVSKRFRHGRGAPGYYPF